MVPYAPGVLSAKGYRGGLLAAQDSVETTGDPAAVRLEPDRTAIDADGRDVSVVTVSVRDGQGRVAPVASNNVQFELEGPGRILGVGNGDPSCHEPDVVFSTGALHRIPVGGWRWKKIADAYAATIPEAAVSLDDSGWDSCDVRAESGPLGINEKGVLRTRFTVTEEELASPAVELWFGRISGDAFVYLNGRHLGGGGPSASVFDVKELLHPGENTLVVVIANYGPAAGINGGVMLQTQDDPEPVAWRRSAFNGLAEVIVQSSRAGGTLKLTARSDGLQPATVEIQANPAPQAAVLP
jgi:beta-galactosidase